MSVSSHGIVTCAALAALCACDEGGAQSEAEALRRLCDAPIHAARSGISADGWIAKNITHGSVVMLFASYKTGAFAAKQAIYALARDRGIERCVLVEPDWSTTALADVGGVASPAADTLPFIVVSATAVGVAGNRVLDTPNATAGGPLFLREVTDAVSAAAGRGDRHVVRIDRSVPYGVFVKVLWAAAPAGQHQFVLSARKGAGEVGLPIDLPRRPPSSSPPPSMIISIENGTLKLWSMDGSDGTSSTPVYTSKSDQLGGLQAALVESVTRRFKGASRSAEQRAVVLMLPRTTAAQDVLDLVSRVQVGPGGVELYPRVEFFPVD